MIRIKYLMKLVKSYEAVKKLKASSFGKQEEKRIELTKDIFKAMVNEKAIESPIAAAIARTYLSAFPYPIFNGLLAYGPLDLVLALNHHYLNDLGRPANELSAIELTQDEAHAIAKALCEDFDPSGIPLDLERKTSGLLGEFRRYLGKNSHIFYTAIEGKRQAQYTALGKGDYYQSTRALKLADLQQEHDQLEEDEESTRRSSTGLQVDNKPSLMERVMAKREAKRNLPAATPTPPQDQPEQIEDSESLELELVEETVEIPEDAYSQESEDYDYGMEFEDAEEEEIETIDYDEDEDNSNESWVKLV